MKRAPPQTEGMEILEHADQSLLEIIDHVLNKGVLVKGEVFLGGRRVTRATPTKRARLGLGLKAMRVLGVGPPGGPGGRPG